MKSATLSRFLAGLLILSLLVHDLGANGWMRMGARPDMPAARMFAPPVALRAMPAPKIQAPPQAVSKPPEAPALSEGPSRLSRIWAAVSGQAGRLRSAGRACVASLRKVAAASVQAPAGVAALQAPRASEVRALPAPWTARPPLSLDARPEPAVREPEPVRLPAPWDGGTDAGKTRRMLWVPETVEAGTRVQDTAPPTGKSSSSPVIIERGDAEPMVEKSSRKRFGVLPSLSGLKAETQDMDGFKAMSLTQWLGEAPAKTAAFLKKGADEAGLKRQEILTKRIMENQRYTTKDQFAQLGRKAKFLPGKSYTDLLLQDPGARYTNGYVPGEKYGVVTEMSDGTLYSTCSPLIFDLDGNGVRTSDRRVRYDVNGEGRVDFIHDVSSGDGLLVFDADKNGVSGENGRETFGDNTDLDGNGRPDGFKDGFEALEGLVKKAVSDKILAPETLRGHVLDARTLGRLEKAYGLRMRVGGIRARNQGLREAGVAAISLASGAKVRVKDFDGQGNEVLRQEGASFTRADGSRGVYEDVWFTSEVPKLRGTPGGSLLKAPVPAVRALR